MKENKQTNKQTKPGICYCSQFFEFLLIVSIVYKNKKKKIQQKPLKQLNYFHNVSFKFFPHQFFFFLMCCGINKQVSISRSLKTEVKNCKESSFPNLLDVAS